MEHHTHQRCSEKSIEGWHTEEPKMERRSIIFGASIALTMALTAPTIAAGMEMNQGGMNHSGMNHSGMNHSGMSGKQMMSKKRMKMHRMMMTHGKKMHSGKNM
jgi:hypothetical protein